MVKVKIDGKDIALMTRIDLVKIRRKMQHTGETRIAELVTEELTRRHHTFTTRGYGPTSCEEECKIDWKLCKIPKTLETSESKGDLHSEEPETSKDTKGSFQHDAK